MSATNRYEEGLFDGADVIHFYSRAQAIADGELVDFSVMAKAAGFNRPLAMTSAVYIDCVKWTEEDAKAGGPEDENGRAWDILTALKFAMATNPEAQAVTFCLSRTPRAGYGTARTVNLKAVIGPGDTPDPVITIMEPGES